MGNFFEAMSPENLSCTRQLPKCVKYVSVEKYYHLAQEHVKEMENARIWKVTCLTILCVSIAGGYILFPKITEKAETENRRLSEQANQLNRELDHSRERSKMINDELVAENTDLNQRIADIQSALRTRNIESIEPSDCSLCFETVRTLYTIYILI